MDRDRQNNHERLKKTRLPRGGRAAGFGKGGSPSNLFLSFMRIPKGDEEFDTKKGDLMKWGRKASTKRSAKTPTNSSRPMHING